MPLNQSGFPRGLIPDAYFPNPTQTLPNTQAAHSVQTPFNMLTQNEIHRQLVDIVKKMGLDPGTNVKVYKKPYPEQYDAVPYPRGYKVPDFPKFNGEDGRTTLEHVGQFLAQLGEAGSYDAYKIRMFPLSLSGTAFSWFSTLAPDSIHTWSQLEHKFHEHLYTGDNELRLSHLTSVKQKHDESVTDYIMRFKDTKNRCFSVVISEKDLVDLALDGLRSHIKDKLDGREVFNINQLLQKALVQESRAKDNKEHYKTKSDRPHIHNVSFD